MAVTLSSTAYFIITAVMVLGVLIGISMMSKVKTARYGNALSAFCSIIAILVTMNQNEVLTAPVIWIAIAIGAVLSLICAAKVKMIQMPQVVAFLNGLGGLSSALVAILSVTQANDRTSKYIAVLALVIGFVTFTGSMVAAGKLAKLLNLPIPMLESQIHELAERRIIHQLAGESCPAYAPGFPPESFTASDCLRALDQADNPAPSLEEILEHATAVLRKFDAKVHHQAEDPLLKDI